MLEIQIVVKLEYCYIDCDHLFQQCVVNYPSIYVFDTMSLHLCFTLCTLKPVTRDHPLRRDHLCSNMSLHFYTFVSLIKDHLSYKTATLCCPTEWCPITYFSVLLSVIV